MEIGTAGDNSNPPKQPSSKKRRYRREQAEREREKCARRVRVGKTIMNKAWCNK